MLTQPRGLPCDPGKLTYRYADLDEPEIESPREKWRLEVKVYEKGYFHLRRFQKPAKEKR